MSTYKFSDTVTAMWPFPPAVITTTISKNAPWPFPKSPPQEPPISPVTSQAEAEFSIDELLDEPTYKIEAINATQEARQQGVQFCHVIERNQQFGFNGITIAYRRCGEWRNSKMVEVAVVYCSQHDNFNKKIGCAWAAEKFLQNNTVVIPARSNKDDDSVVDNLKELFWYQLSDMH